MKNKFIQTVAGTILGLLMLVGGTQIFASGQNSEKQGLIGTWRTSITPRNCQTGDPVAPAFPGLLTFNQGGTLTGTSTAVSSAFGIWEASNHIHTTFALSFIGLSPDGTFAGVTNVRHTVTLGAGGNDFTSTGTVEIFAANGTLIATGCSTSTATRFE